MSARTSRSSIRRRWRTRPSSRLPLAPRRNGKAEIWAATQNQRAVHDTVGKALNIGKDNVLCDITFLGGRFWRQSKHDDVAEAALLVRQTGRPVKIVWSREDDIHFDYFHFLTGLYIKAAVG